MNNKIKWLEKKIVIQLFGFGLFISPFINYFIYFSMIKKQINAPWSQMPIVQILSQGHYFKYALSLASIAIGIIMLRGSGKAWRYVMGLLTCYIVIQIPTIGADIKANWFWGPMFLLNCGLLFFIADQLVFKNSDYTKNSTYTKKSDLTESLQQNNSNTWSSQQTKKNTELQAVSETNSSQQNKSHIANSREIKILSKKYSMEFMSNGIVGEIFDLNQQGFKLKLLKPIQTSIHNQLIEVSFDKLNYRLAEVNKVSPQAIEFKFKLQLDNKRQAV